MIEHPICKRLVVAFIRGNGRCAVWYGVRPLDCCEYHPFEMTNGIKVDGSVSVFRAYALMRGTVFAFGKQGVSSKMFS